jgi:mannose-6-phosphate isomerase-like protein (cupin superfamily)
MMGFQERRKAPMEPFTIVNMLELDDAVSGRVEGLEGRFARAHLDSRDLGVSHFRYAPNLRSTMGHRHGEQEEAYIVVAGSGQVMLDDEIRALSQWDVVRVSPPVTRAFAAGPDGMDIIAIGGPKPEGRDGEMLEVVWPD